MTDDIPYPPRPAPLDWGLAMGLGMPRFAARRFTAGDRSLSPVRAFVRHTLTRWELTAALDDVTLVACELTANALGHALHGEHAAGCGWLALVHTRHTVLCTATDPDPRFSPGPRHDGHYSHDNYAGHAERDWDAESTWGFESTWAFENGWGLAIVRALSDAWGWRRLPDDAGKSVWAKIPV
ncbi:ATP-binding protein [Streptomyces sp. NPDC050610]|uniref:ATP-binding protein n=1 Tax=Streptomyces sp. NPDC050610 TaxID=3157097 RepID=UPI00343AF7CD